MRLLLLVCLCFLLTVLVKCQNGRTVGKLHEVFAWKQMTYDINGNILLHDRFAEDDLAGGGRRKRSPSNLFFNNNDGDERDWDERPVWLSEPNNEAMATTVNPIDEVGQFYIKYNNLPMGAERVGNRLFVTIPRRRYGIPATLNYIDLSRHRSTRSPPLTPYPDMRRSRSLISVYRTRADECGRLWTVDTGVVEIPNNPRYLQPPAIVVYDLRTDRQILRYQLKPSDLPANNTATGLASITVFLKNGDCADAYAYIADVASYGVIVYSLRENDSWRHSHNYFSFNPTAGNLRVGGQTFQWNDGVFSLTVGRPDGSGCRPTYFHPMVSTQEFVVSSCDLETRNINQTSLSLTGDRGDHAQSTMHGLHIPTNVIFFAEIGRDAVTCWNVDKPLTANNVETLAQDSQRLIYPSDLHITGDEVWVMSNSLPRFIYSRLDTNQYNFYVYKASIRDLIAGTACASRSNSGRRNNRMFNNK